MAGTLRTRLQAYVRAQRRKPAPARLQPPPKLPRVGRSSQQALDHRLASEPHRLERLVAVQPNTIAVVLPSDQPPQVRQPGEQLRPSLLSGRRPSYVVVVSTVVTRLDLTLAHLVTLDQDVPIDHVKIRVEVQVSDRDNYAGLINAAMLNHPDLDEYLTESVKRELAEKVRRAAKMNRMADLRRKGLDRVLTEGWFPPSFAEGVLVAKGFSVLETAWPREEPVRALHAVPADGPLRGSDAEPTLVLTPVSDLDLTVERGLQRVWSRHVDAELIGIAGAKVRGGTTVVAATDREPGTYEGTRLREAFGDYYADDRVRLICAVGHSYADLVRAWFRQVDSWPRRLVSVTSEEGDAVLRIRVDQGRLSPEDQADGVWVGQESDREALQRLLPHERVEFVAAEPG